jgi:hypothetical protein
LTTSPLSFEDIRQRRREAVAAATARTIQKRKEAPRRSLSLAPPPADLFESMPSGTANVITSLAPPPLGGFVPPDAETALVPAPQDEPFGSGVVRGVANTARFLNRRLPWEQERPEAPFGLEPTMNPIRLGSQLIGLSGRLGQRAATQVIAGSQKYLIPGRQELETLLDEELAGGKGYVDALDSAFRRAGREGGVRIPFARTAVTPEGSITVDWEDVIAAGFDPIDLALTVGTGGASKAVKGTGRVLDAARKGLAPVEAAGRRKAPLAAQPATTRRVVGEVPDLGKLQLQTFGGTQKGLGKMVNAVNPNLKQRIMGTAFRPITGVLNPTAVAGTNPAKRAPIVYEAASAYGANMTQAALDWVRAAGDPSSVFHLSKDQVSRLPNIKLTAKGRQVFASRGLPTTGPFAFGDIAEYWVRGEAPDVSLFKGLAPEQVNVLERLRRVYRELAEYAQREGILETKKGVTVGQKFAEQFGSPGDIFAWVHRAAAGKKIVNESGKIEELLFNTGRGGSGKTNPFTKTRTYELMQEGLADGIRYVNPMESLETIAAAVYRQVAEKRALAVLENTGKLVTSAQVMSKLYPGIIAQKEAAEKFVAATEANIRRIKRKIANRKAKSPLLKDADELADDDVIRNGHTYAATINKMQDELIEGMQFLARSKTAANDGLRRRFRNLYRERLGRFKAVREEAERIFSEHQRLYRRTLASHRRIVSNDSEIFGFTNDLGQAEAQHALAQLARMRATREHAKTMEQIADATDLDVRVFGGPAGGFSTEVTHFREGPLAGKIAPKDFAEPLAERLRDRGMTVNIKGRERRPLAVIEQFTGAARTLAAGSADVGWLGIQGALLAATHPAIWAKAAGNSLRAVLDPELRARYIAANYDHLLSFIENAGDIGSSEFVQSLDRMGAWGRLGAGIERKVASKWGDEGVDVLNKMRRYNPVTRLGTGFNVFQDVGKLELWKSMRGFTATDALTARELTSHINNMLGTLNTRMLGVSPTQRQIEGGLLLFSPRYTRSAFALVAELARSSGRPGTLEGLATRESMRAIGSFIAAGTLLMYAVGEATGSEVQLDPLKPGWLSVKIGGQQVGISGATRSLLDTLFRITAIASGTNENSEMADLVGFDPFNPEHRSQNPILQYALGRMPPGIREILTRETFDGQKIEGPAEMTRELAKEFLPFALQAQLFPPPGVEGQSPLAMIPESLGLRARPLSAYERLQEAQDRIAGEAAGRPWKDLDADKQAVLRRDNPELRDLEENLHAVPNARFGPYFDRIAQDRETRNELIEQAAAEFRATGNGRTFRAKYDEAMAQHRLLRRRTEADFADQVAELDRRRERKLADSPSDFNRVLDRYASEVKDNPNFVDQFGNPDWDRINEADQAFRRDVGEDIYRRIRQLYLGFDENGVPLRQEYTGQEFVWQLRRAREALREAGYWQIADDIVGDDPEARAIWRWYENSENPAEREAIKGRFRAIRRIERIVDRNRERIRRRNPDVDTALMLFYGTRAASPQGRRLERQIQSAARAQPVK